MDSTKKVSNPGRKTNNSQSAGMSGGSVNKPTSGTTNTPRAKEIALDTNTQNVFTPGTPDISEGLDIPETLSFQTAQERDRQTPLPEITETEYPDIEDLTNVGAPFAFEDLPDRGAYKEILVEFPSCMPFSSFGETVTDTGPDRSEKIFALAGRHRQALQLGEAALRRPIYSSYDKVVTRKGRKNLFKEEMDILRELLSNLYYFNDGTNPPGFALQKIILVNLNHRLKLRRNEAEEDLITSGEGIPSLPRWGLHGKADEFWTGNDFEILGACFRREVENFLAYLAEHHDFTKVKNNKKQDQRVVIQSNVHRKTTINPPVITTIRDLQPAFVEGEPESISAYLKRSKPRSNRQTVNMNTSMFGHPAQNSSSHAFRELLGVTHSNQTGESKTPEVPTSQKAVNSRPGSVRESREGENESDYSHSHKSGSQNVRPRGGGDPGGSDGDDSDDGGSKGPRGGPRKLPSQGNPRNNPFLSNSDDTMNPSTAKPIPEPQFDTKLKLDAIPTWDGNPEGLRRWFLKINSLAKRSTTVFKQLGMLVPTRLTGSAEVWYYSQSIETRDRIECDWSTLRAAIGEYYMNRAFLDKQKARANRASYRDTGNGKETPSEYIIRKMELLQFIYNYTDRELINEIMEGAPSYWTPIVTPHLLQDLEQFQLSVKFHEDSLLKLGGGENSYARPAGQNYSKDSHSPHRNQYNPFRNAHVNLVGWSKATANPQYPRDDSNVSPRGTPEEKGARPCRHCGSGKHWDKDCKHARKWEKRARTNMAVTTAEDDRAQENYDDVYYERFSDEEDMENSADFQRPSQS